MATFNIKVSGYDSVTRSGARGVTSSTAPSNGVFYSAVYTVTGLKPNSNYDFYVNDQKKNTSVSQGDHSSYILDGIKKAQSWGSFSDIGFLLKFALQGQLRAAGVTTLGPVQGTSSAALTTYINQSISKIGENTSLRSDSSGRIRFTFFPSMSGFFTVGIGLGGSSTAWNIKSLQLKGPSAVTISKPAPKPLPPPEPAIPPKQESTTVQKRISTTTYENAFPEDTLASEVSLYFDFIQTFYLDPAKVNNVDTVALHSVDLFFTKKPNRQANINQSNIQDPGCHIYICEVENGEPDLRKTYITSKVRLDYETIAKDLNAEVATNFEFKNSIALKTGKSYGIVVNFEDPNYTLGIAKTGSKIISGESWASTSSATAGTESGTTLATGDIYTGNYRPGKLYRASNYGETDNNPLTSESLYRALNDSDLKFRVNIHKYDTSAGTQTIELVNHDYEFAKVSSFPLNSLDQSFFIEDLLYVDYGNPSANVFYAASADLFEVADSVAVPPATSTIVFRPETSSVDIGGQTVQVISPTEDEQRLNQLEDYLLAPGLQYKENQSRNFTGLNSLENNFIIAQNINKISLPSSAGNDPIIKDGYHITYALSVSSSDRPEEVALTDLTEYHNIDTSTFFPNSFYYTSNSSGVSIRDDDILVRPAVMYMVDDIDYTTNTVTMLASDPTVAISANGINDVTWTGDTNWSAGDVITVTGGDEDGYITVLANTSGGNIASLVITNPGSGLPSSPTVILPTDAGQAATITVTPGAQLVSSITGLRTNISELTDLNVDEILPNFGFRTRNGTISPLRINYAHDPSSDNNYTLTAANQEEIDNDSILSIEKYNATLLSRSNEIANNSSLGVSTSEGKSSLISFDLTINNEYESPEILSSFATVYTFENLINNDSTNEYLPDSGNADSRYISKRIEFARDRYAEDVRVFSTLWRPSGTNVKYYLKAHNSADEESFDDKYWTELEVKDFTLEKEFSSLDNPSDLVEYTLGLKPYPEINTPYDGTVTVTGTTVTSSGPLDLSTTGLDTGSIVVLYDEEFPETTYIVSRVTSTPIAGSFSISDNISNVSITSAVLRIANTSKPYEVFSDAQNGGFARYFTETGDDFLTYNSMSVKAVLLSNTSFVIPHVEDIRAIGVSV
jgi:hypothetical protein